MTDDPKHLAIAVAELIKTTSREALNEATTVALEAHTAEILRVTREATNAVVRSPQFATQVREIVRGAALECAKEILAEMLPGLEGQVRAIVHEHWDKSVAATAHGILDDKLAEVRRKFA
jgi:hypothetical protein